MAETCGQGPTGEMLAEHFPELKCDKPKVHGGAHHSLMKDGSESWYLDDCIGREELMVLESIADAAREQVRAVKREARERAKAERAAAKAKTQSADLFGSK